MKKKEIKKGPCQKVNIKIIAIKNVFKSLFSQRSMKSKVGYAETVDIPQRWKCRNGGYAEVIKSIESFLLNLIQLKLFCIYLNCNLELKYFNLI